MARKIGPGALIGMHATLLSGARVGADAIIGMDAVVLEGQEIPPETLAVGIPASPVRNVAGGAGRAVATRYVERAQRYRSLTEDTS